MCKEIGCGGEAELALPFARFAHNQLSDDGFSVGRRGSARHRNKDCPVLRNAVSQHSCIRPVNLLRIIHVAAVFKSRAGCKQQSRKCEKDEGRFHDPQINAEPCQVSIPEGKAPRDSTKL